ncbi:MAG: amino acid adenylation domain-containing protein [Lutisporaceae bacterium]
MVIQNKLDRNNVENFMSLTSLQQGMLFHYVRDELSTEYHEQLSLSITGDLKIDLLQKSWDFVIENNEMLRTVFRWKGIDNPIQIVLKKHQILVQYMDFTNELNKYKAVENIKLRDLSNRIDITKETLRIYLCKLDDCKYEMIISNHHILYDGWSNGIILKELMEVYTCLYKNKEIQRINKTKFIEFIKYTKNLNRNEQKNYWMNYLNDLGSEDDYFSCKEKGIYKEISYKIDAVKANKIKDFAKENKILLSSILYGIWGVLIQKINDSNEALFGTTVSGRPENIKSIDNMVGLFINTIPLRIKSENNLTFVDLIHDVNIVLNLRKDFENTALIDIKEYCKLSAEELFNSIVTIENYPLDLNLNKGNILHIENFSIIEKTNYNIALEILTFDILEFKFNFNSLAIDENMIKKLGGYLEKLIDTLLNNSNIKILEVDLLSEKERNQVIYEFNAAKVDYPKDKTIQELFEAQAEKAPNNIAMVFQDKKLTYRELNEKANSLARVLRKKGVKADSIVGIMVERSLEMIVGIMGILKAGGAYLPIDPEYPKERIEYMLKDSESKVLLSKNTLVENIEYNGEFIDLFEDDIFSGDLSNLEKINDSNNLAYIIYTSGTTGKPKGAMLKHSNLNNFVTCFNRQFKKEFGSDDRVLSLTNYVFDVSVCEFFVSLTSGAALYINDKHKTFDPMEIGKLIIDNKITFTYIPPSLLSDVYENLKIDKNNVKLKKLLVGVEAIRGETLNKFYDLNEDIEIVNGYGPTEATICSTFYRVSKNEVLDKTVPIGKPVGNTSIYILNKFLKAVPVGIVGEIYISGASVARGYLNKSELTSEKFVENPFKPGTKMYMTGDLASWLPDGNIEFLGRRDNQVKIRGFRIELGEIENKILQHEAVKETVVIVKENKEKEKCICAYVVSEKDINELNLKGYLKETLPEYMVPAYFVQLDKLPLTSNGKLDRRALPEPNLDYTLNEYEAPRNEIEEKLSKIWSEVLGIEKVGINDNFFDLGGHSLKATALISKIHKELNKEIPLKELFKSPTIKAISKFIESAEENLYSKIEKVEEKEFYAASSAQKRMYILQQFDRDSVAYNMHVVFELEGAVNKEKIEETFKNLVIRHETLRTYFEAIEGEIVQKIDNSYEFKLVKRKDNEEIKYIINKFVRPFELEKSPLFRVELLESNEKTYLLIDMHHIISDGISTGILIKEFTALYKKKELEPLKLQYKDFAAWQNDFLISEEIKKQEAYWINRFNDEIPLLNLPTDYERPSIQSFEGDSISFEVNEKLTESLTKLTKETGTTMHMLLLSAFNILLSKYSGQEDIVVGTPIAGRPHADLENIMGMFVNTLAMRNYPSGEKTFREFLGEVKENALGAYENQDYQFEELVEKLNIARDFSRNPVFDVMFTLQNMDIGEATVEGIKIRPYKSENRISKFDMTMNEIELENSICISIQYCTKLFSKATIERMYKHLENIMQAITENIDTKLSEVAILTEEERQQILIDFNNTKADYPSDKTIHQLFEEQVERTPDNKAVVYEDKHLTYRELNERANQLARVLRARGVVPDSIVGMMVERSLEMIVGIIGILKAGGAYLPIDPKYPQDRIKYMLEDSGASPFLTQAWLYKDMVKAGEVIELDNEDTYQGEKDNLDIENRPDNLAYVIYTSGSTGKPKGVMIENSSVINLVYALKDKVYKDNVSFKVAMVSPYIFDASVKQIFPSLLLGHSLYIVPEATRYDGKKLIDYYIKNNIDISDGTPSHIRLITSSDNNNLNAIKIKKFIIGGEALSNEIIDGLLSKLMNDAPDIVNVYGPTECCVDSTLSVITKKNAQDMITIGKPLNNYRIYIVDKHFKLCPVGVPGELCISGEGLARSYLNRPELTAEKFVANPFELSAEIGFVQRMYRTGDLARWLPDGNIEFMGRIDHQVKIRGYRIELGEIESKLLSHEAVKEAIVTARDDDSGNKYLCAYIVGAEELMVSELREQLSKDLPNYMMPSYFIQLEKLPLTPNGKIDRKALPEPDGSISTGAEYEAPRNETEEILVNIWQKVLGVERIGINDSFFELGGHSLKATNLAAKIQKAFEVEIALGEIFKNPTIKEISNVILGRKNNKLKVIKPAEEREYYPVSSSQKRLYILNQIDDNNTSYNMPALMNVEGNIDIQKFEQTFNLLIRRHEALRTTFEFIDGCIVQKIQSIQDMPYFKISYDESLLDIEKLMNKYISPFKLTKAPLLRVALIKRESNKYLFILDMHHIISDGISMNIMINEFMKLYAEEELPALEIQYRDYAVWETELYQNEHKKLQEKYWLNKLEGLPNCEFPITKLSKVINNMGSVVRTVLDEQIVSKIDKYCKKNRITKFTFMLTVLKILLFGEINQTDICIGIPIAGRKYSGLENIIGVFLNMQIIRTKIQNDLTFAEYMKIVDKTVLEAQDNQDYPYEELYAKVRDTFNYQGSSLFSIMLNYMPYQEGNHISIEGLLLEPIKLDKHSVKYNTTLYVRELADEMTLSLDYNNSLYTDESMEKILNNMEAIINMVLENENILIQNIGAAIYDYLDDIAISVENEIDEGSFDNDDFF